MAAVCFQPISLTAWSDSVRAVPEEALVAYYPLNEGAGDRACDLSGNGNDGKIKGAQWTKLGKRYALEFDGIDDHIFCGRPAALDIRGPLTLSVWVLPEEVPAGEVGIAGKQFTSYLLTYYRTRRIFAYIGEGANNVESYSNLQVGTWNHIVSTFDGENLRLYLNGQLIGERFSKYKETPAGKDFVIGSVAGDVEADDPNYTQSGFFRGMIANVKVYVRALSGEEIQAQFASAGKQWFEASQADVRPIRAAKTIRGDGLVVWAGNDGAIQINIGDSFCVIQSTFSYPGEGIGTNRLGRTSDGSDFPWRPRVESATGNALRIWAAGQHYSLTRTVEINNGKVEFEDTVTNLGDKPVGILIKHTVATPKTFATSRLGMGSEEPIVFVALPDYDLGIVVEDDIARAQFSPFSLGNQTGFQLSHFALDGGKSYTFKWTLYAMEPTGDPFVFINKVREDWGVNHTILGPCSLFGLGSGSFGIDAKLLDDPEGLRKYLQRKKLGVVISGMWLDYDPGSFSYTPSRAEYKELMQRAYKAFKAADPDIKVLGSIECDWVSIFPDKMKGGEKLPRPGQSTSIASVSGEVKQVLLDANFPWNDSMKVQEDGTVLLELYTRRGKPQWALGVYPAPGNYQASYLMEQAKFICEEVGLDGFYVDEFTASGSGWMMSVDRWDGYTVDVDPDTGKVSRQYADANVAGIQPRLDLCRYAVDNNRIMIANTYATTIAESCLPVMRFSETWSSFYPPSIPKIGKPPYIATLARSQLGTMIGLGIDGRHLKRGNAEQFMRCLILFLRHGMVYYHYFYPDFPETGEGSGEYGPINHMFPITPVRLFEGGIIGEERTITCVSGTYMWNHKRPPRILLFDEVGRQKKHNLKPEKADAGWKVVIELRDWQEIAVVE